MSTPRIEPEIAHRKVRQGDAVLICAYKSSERCERIALEAASGYGARKEGLPLVGFVRRG